MRFSVCGQYHIVNNKKEKVGNCVNIKSTCVDKEGMFEDLVEKLRAKSFRCDMYFEAGFKVCEVFVDDEELDEFKQLYLTHKREWRKH